MAKLKPVLFALLTLALSAAAGIGAMRLAGKFERTKGTPVTQLLGMAAAGVTSSTILFVATRRKKNQLPHVVDGNPSEIDEPAAPKPPGTYEEWRADLDKAEGMDGLEQFVRKWSGRTRLPRQPLVGPPPGCIAPRGPEGSPGLVPLSREEFHPVNATDGARGMQGHQGPRADREIRNVQAPSDNVIRYVNDVIKDEKAYDPWPSHRPIKTGLWVRTYTGQLAKVVKAEPTGGWNIETENGISWRPLASFRPALPKKGERWSTRSGGPRVFESDITVDQDMFAHAVWSGDLQPVNFGRGPA